MGLNGANTVFTEINNTPTLSADTVDTRTAAMTYVLGWNYIG